MARGDCKTKVTKHESVGTFVEIPFQDSSHPTNVILVLAMLEDFSLAVCGSNNILALNEHSNCLVLSQGQTLSGIVQRR